MIYKPFTSYFPEVCNIEHLREKEPRSLHLVARTFKGESKMQTSIEQQGPQVMVVSLDVIPEAANRGRKSIMSFLPFWRSMEEKLSKGLSRSEAIEIDLRPIKTESGKTIDVPSLLSRFRHAFRKSGWCQKYDTLVRNKSSLFIVDHETYQLATVKS
jgi:hypothetical protein